jgi:hypothetical protein
MVKVKLIPVNNFGRNEFKPANELAVHIAAWLDKKHLSDRDKRFIEKIGLEAVVLEYGEVKE